MEIKVGDKMRVREDAPKEFDRFKDDGRNYEVAEISPTTATIQHKLAGLYGFVLSIPVKYLTKVEDKAKEPKFKRGDMVRIIKQNHPQYGKVATVDTFVKGVYPEVLVNLGGNLIVFSASDLEPYTEPKPKYQIGDKVRKKKWDKDTTISYVEWHGTWQTYVYRFAEQEYGFNCHKEGDITLVSRRTKEPKFKAGDCVKISFEWGELPVGEKLVIKRLETIDCRNAYMYSIEGYDGRVIESMLHPYSEPTKQTEAEKKPNVGSITIPVKVDLDETYWSAYAADLAKEIAVKVANKYSDPKEAGEYAVKVAEVVVAGLKRK